MYYTLENFINFCNDMMIAEEGKLMDKIKAKFSKKKKKDEYVKPISSDDPEFLSSRKKVYSEIERNVKRALQEIYRKYPKIKQTKAVRLNMDIDREEFLTCPNMKSLTVLFWSVWDYTPTARTDEDGEAYNFTQNIIFGDIPKILNQYLGDDFKIDFDCDWDDGYIFVEMK